MMSARFNSRVVPMLMGILALVMLMATPGAAAPGDLDPTFDADGKVTTDFGSRDSGRAMAIQGDGKIVVAGFTGPTDEADFALARYNTNGSLDPTFDGDGKVTTDFQSMSDSALAVAIQADGKIVAAGAAFTASGGGDFALARYNTDGSLDPTFGVGGKVTTDVAGVLEDVAFAVAIQTDGKIVAAGSAFTAFNTDDFALARYNPDGSLDPTFGVAGKVTTDFQAGNDDAASAVTIQGNGRIVAAGYSLAPGTYDFALARYNSDGSLDATFDTDGLMTTDFAGDTDQALDVAIQGDGKIVAAGFAFVSGTSDFALARYNTAGSLDATFSGDGKMTTDFAGGIDQGFGVAIQGDGKIVAAGGARVSGASDFALARYNSDGSLDTTFSGDGKVTTDFGGASDIAHGVAIQADGKIVAAGCALCVSSSEDFALARYKVCRTTSRRSSIPCR